MALITPNSRIDFLGNIPFDPDYENTMYFDTIAQQEAYFSSRILRTLNQNSYQRVGKNYLKVGWVADSNGNSVINVMYNVHYMRFKNTNFENKWFYAFIDKVEYINNNTVGIYYHLDVMQTWHFDYSFNECMIERQHTETDVIGQNTIPEDFELGDYIFDHASEFDYEPCAIVVTAGDFGGNYGSGVVVPGLQAKGNWFSGVHFYPYVLSNANAVNNLNQMLEDAYTDRDKLNTIIAVFVMPNQFASTPANPQVITENIVPSGSTSGYPIGSYPARNAKLMTYPYNMLYVTNYQGGHNELHYEYFANPSRCKMKIWGNLSANPGLILYPVDYKTTGDNFDEMLQLTGFPMCAWANDAFKAWVAQNAGTLYASASAIALSATTAVLGKGNGSLGALGGMPSFGNSFDAQSAGALAIQNANSMPAIDNKIANGAISSHQLMGSIIAAGMMVGKVADHYFMPPTAHGNSNGNVQYQSGKMTFMWCHKHIREEYAKIIDGFFDMYGYAVHKVGIPNRNARPCYTYVKTAKCSIDGPVPIEDVKQIEAIFDKGVRFWRSSSVFGVYSSSANNNAPIV